MFRGSETYIMITMSGGEYIVSNRLGEKVVIKNEESVEIPSTNTSNYKSKENIGRALVKLDNAFNRLYESSGRVCYMVIYSLQFLVFVFGPIIWASAVYKLVNHEKSPIPNNELIIVIMLTLSSIAINIACSYFTIMKIQSLREISKWNISFKESL